MQEIVQDSRPQMRLYDGRNQRLYINAHERKRFLSAAHNADQTIGNFALTLLYSGCRLSEALALTFADLNEHGRLLSIRSLKKRKRHEMREVPIPLKLAFDLSEMRDQLQASNECSAAGAGGNGLWSPDGRRPSRITGYRWIKGVMAQAGIEGAQASPKGLRHGYGVHAICSGVQLNMLRKWMGHASLSTTAIYANAVGKEELAIADRMWWEQTVNFEPQGSAHQQFDHVR
ncbi:MAG: site-specific integrase [Rhizobiaceae bacterium]